MCIRERETLTKRCIKRTHKSLNNWYEVKVVLDRRCTRYILLLYIYHIFEIYLRPKQRSRRVLFVFPCFFLKVVSCDFMWCLSRLYAWLFLLAWVHGTPKIYTKISKWNATQLNQRHQRILLYIDFFWRSLYTRVIWRIHAYSIFFERARCVYVSASIYILLFAKIRVNFDSNHKRLSWIDSFVDFDLRSCTFILSVRWLTLPCSFYLMRFDNIAL